MKDIRRQIGGPLRRLSFDKKRHVASNKTIKSQTVSHRFEPIADKADRSDTRTRTHLRQAGPAGDLVVAEVQLPQAGGVRRDVGHGPGGERT